MKTIVLITAFIITSFSLFSQTKEDRKKAYELAIKAINLMDNGEIDESIELLQEASTLVPDDSNYPYELGYAYYLKEDYLKSIDYFKKVVEMKDANDQGYQMLGNAYDMSGQRDLAVKIYIEGLEKFPSSGNLYLELGVTYHEKDWNQALLYHEKGIQVDPLFSSNYYWAARIFCASDEEVWGVLYGEIFMNLERGSARTEEMSKLLYETYSDEIQFDPDSSFSVSFSKQGVIYSDNKKIKLPYGVGIFEPCLMIACVGEDTITMASLNRIRNRFISLYLNRKYNKRYPNILFDWHKELIDNGYFECYNYWLFNKGSNEFNVWYSDNSEKFAAFIKWFTDHPMKIDEKHTFHRLDY